MYYRNENGQNKVSFGYTMTYSEKDLRPHKGLSFWQRRKLIYVDQFHGSAYFKGSWVNEVVLYKDNRNSQSSCAGLTR